MTTKKQLFDRLRELAPPTAVAMQAVRLIELLPYEAAASIVEEEGGFIVVDKYGHIIIRWYYSPLSPEEVVIARVFDQGNDPVVLEVSEDGEYVFDLLQSDTIEWPEALLAAWRECYEACVPLPEQVDYRLDTWIAETYTEDKHWWKPAPAAIDSLRRFIHGLPERLQRDLLRNMDRIQPEEHVGWVYLRWPDGFSLSFDEYNIEYRRHVDEEEQYWDDAPEYLAEWLGVPVEHKMEAQP